MTPGRLRAAWLGEEQLCKGRSIARRPRSAPGACPGQEPSCREQDGGGWAGCPDPGTGAGGRGDGLQPPGAIPAAQPDFTPRGKAGEPYTPSAPPEHRPLFPANPTPSRGYPCAEPPPMHSGSMPVRQGVRSPPAAPSHLQAGEAAGPKRLRRAHAFPETESWFIIANVIAAAKGAASRSRQYPA